MGSATPTLLFIRAKGGLCYCYSVYAEWLATATRSATGSATATRLLLLLLMASELLLFNSAHKILGRFRWVLLIPTRAHDSYACLSMIPVLIYDSGAYRSFQCVPMIPVHSSAYLWCDKERKETVFLHLELRTIPLYLLVGFILADKKTIGLSSISFVEKRVAPPLFPMVNRAINPLGIVDSFPWVTIGKDLFIGLLEFVFINRSAWSKLEHWMRLVVRFNQ